LDGLTRSSRPAANWRARASLLVGLLSLAALPVAVALAEVQQLYDLIYAAAAIPAGFLGGALSVWLARRARRRTERTLGRVGGRASAALGRLLGVLAMLLALAAGIAVATYVFLDRFAD
jgi:peptidoglycan/LPS O-acetylase OafA/YrhL